jgi:hypothetical protein
MKKISTLLVAVTLCHFAFSQSNRLTLVEEFTQASCPPCALQNPAFDDLLLSNPDKVVTLKYHTDWPGVDEMNAQNTSDVQSRVTYYSINGVPMGAMDGFVWPDYDGYTSSADQYKGAPYQCSQGLIDSMQGISAPFTLTATHWLSSDRDSIYATITINALSAVSGSLVAQVAVIEKDVNFLQPPGTNGETEFDAVMKKMLPSASGTTLASSWNAGDSYSFTVGWKLANIYDMNQLGVVAFIQNNSGKAVLQAAYSEPQQLTDMAVVSTLSTSTVITCDGNTTPVVIISNTGSNTVISATISYDDNGTPYTYNWTGSIAPGLSSADITLPSLTLSTGSHVIHASISNVNGVALNAGIIAPFTSVTSFGTATVTPIVEGFANTTFPPANWAINNPNGDDTYTRVTTTGSFQQTPYNSVKYPFYAVAAGLYDELYIQNFDLSDGSQTEAYLEFAIAKAKFNQTGYNDRLQVLASKDCGATWSTLYDKDDNQGLNTATSGSDWKPTLASQWREESVDISSMIGNSNVILKFKAISGYGNNMYLDDINIHYGSLTGIDETQSTGINLFPNPSNDLTTVQLNGAVPAGSKIEFLNLLGQKVYSASAKSSSLDINTSNWDSGLYIFRLVDTDGSVIKQEKLNVTH